MARKSSPVFNTLVNPSMVLGLPDIAVLRRLLVREPVVCLQRL